MTADRRYGVAFLLLAVLVVAGQFLVLLAPLSTVASARALMPLVMLGFIAVSGFGAVWPQINRKILYLAVFSLCWLFISVFFAGSSVAAALSRAAELTIVLFFSISLYGVITRGWFSVRAVLFLVALSFLPVLGLLAARWLSLSAPRTHNWVWEISPFFNIRHIGFVLVPAWIAGSYFLATSARKFPWWGFLFLLLVVAFWSGGRGQLLVMALASMMFFAFVPAYRSRCLKLGLFLVPAAVITASLFTVRQPELGLWRASGPDGASGGLDQFSSGRWSAWSEVLRDCLGQLPFCHGPDGYRFVTAARLETVHPHNWIIQLFSEWGVVGVLLVGLLVALGIKALLVLWKNRAESGRETLVTCVAAWGGYLVYGLVDGVLYHAYPLLVFSVLTALMLAELFWWQGAVAASPEDRIQADGWRAPARVLLALPALILGLHLAVVYADRPGKRPPSPQSFHAGLVRAFPSSTFATDAWIGYWWDQGYPAALEWNRWLMHEGPRPWRAHLREAQWHEEKQQLHKALEDYRGALQYFPRSSRAEFMALRKKIEVIERKLAMNPAEETDPRR